MHTTNDPTSNGGSSREQNFLSDILAGASGGATGAGKEAKLEQSVSDAVATLDEVKQEVINRRFGLGGSAPESLEAIAQTLTERMTSKLRDEIAEERGCSPEDVTISVTDVQEIEAQALRDLRSPRSQN